MKSDKKVAVQLFGGLGNQVFQVVAGMYLAETMRHKTIFKNDLINEFGVSHGEDVSKLLNIDIERSSGNFRSKPLFIKFIMRLEKLGIPFKLSKFTGLYISHEVGFDNNLDLVEQDRTVIGYFQTFKYFERLERKPDLSHRPFLEVLYELGVNPEILRNSTSLHIRRGDYVSKKLQYGLLSADYYERALLKLPSSDKNAILVFSDDPDSAKRILGSSNFFENMIFIKGVTSIDSMVIMSQSKNIIVSNSTFSYWAAMFSTNGTKVIAPDKWYLGMPDPVDLLPSNWNKIPSDWEV